MGTATHDDKNASEGSGSARKDACSKGNQTVEMYKSTEPIVQFWMIMGVRTLMLPASACFIQEIMGGSTG